jgi:hypothetical protein
MPEVAPAPPKTLGCRIYLNHYICVGYNALRTQLLRVCPYRVFQMHCPGSRWNIGWMLRVG